MVCDSQHVFALVDNAPLEYAVPLKDGHSCLVYDDEMRIWHGLGVHDGRYVVIMDENGNRCGGVVRCMSNPDDVRLSRHADGPDVLVAIKPQFMDTGVCSAFLRSGALCEAFPDLSETTLSLECILSRDDYEKKLHLADLAGLDVVNKADCEDYLRRGRFETPDFSYDAGRIGELIDEMWDDEIGYRLGKGCRRAGGWLDSWVADYGEVPSDGDVSRELLCKCIAFQDILSIDYDEGVSSALEHWIKDGLRRDKGIENEDNLDAKCADIINEMDDDFVDHGTLRLPEGVRPRKSLVEDATTLIFGEPVSVDVLRYFHIHVGYWDDGAPACDWCEAIPSGWVADLAEAHMLNFILRVADYCRRTGRQMVV